MIRKNSLFYKLIRIKSSSKLLFDSFMAGFRPEMESCPVCGASHSCTTHASYERNLIDFIQGRPVYHTIKVIRVICSCGHTHAILPDLIIPYNTYGVFFCFWLCTYDLRLFSSVSCQSGVLPADRFLTILFFLRFTRHGHSISVPYVLP